MNSTAILLACGIACAGSAAATTFDCPRTLEVEQSATLADKSWDQVVDRGIGPASLQTYANSRVMLAKPAPKDARQCQMTEALLNKKSNGVISFICD